MHWAVKRNKLEIVKQLINYGANIKDLNYKGKTPFDLADREEEVYKYYHHEIEPYELTRRKKDDSYKQYYVKRAVITIQRAIRQYQTKKKYLKNTSLHSMVAFSLNK